MVVITKGESRVWILAWVPLKLSIQMEVNGWNGKGCLNSIQCMLI